MDKLAKSALNIHINDMVYDILNNALDKPTGEKEELGVMDEEEIEEKDMYLQLSSQVSKLLPHIFLRPYLCNYENYLHLCQILAYRLLLRRAPLPNLLQRAATRTNFRFVCPDLCYDVKFLNQL